MRVGGSAMICRLQKLKKI